MIINIYKYIPPQFHMAPFLYGNIMTETLALNKTKVELEYMDSTEIETVTLPRLPPLLDVNEDFCTIIIESEKFGRTHWTNTTNSAEIARLNRQYRYFTDDPLTDMTYEDHSIVLKYQKNFIGELNGTNTFDITIIDERGNSREYKQFFVVFTVDPEREDPYYDWDPTDPDDDDFLVKAWIHDINEFGQVIILFNVNISTAFVNITEMNTTYIDMYIEPYSRWDLGIERFNMTKLNFTWDVTHYHGRELYIQCNFYSPPNISPMSTFDNMVFHIKEKREFFRSLNEGVNIHDDYTTLRHKVKRQSNDAWIGDTPEKITSSLFFLLMFSGLMALMMQGSAAMMIGMINGLQLITHLPTMDVPFPANVMTFLRSFIEITQFEVLPFIGKVWFWMFPGLKKDDGLFAE
jgi:hypothetical protein